MERNADLYKPARKDNAYHSAPFEWWHWDGTFDNGYAMWTFWGCGEPTGLSPEARFVWVFIAKPDGTLVQARPYFPLHETTASTETCDARWGDNYIRGEYPKWEVYFRHGDTGFHLFYENICQGFREPPDGCYLGRIQEPPTAYYFTEVMHPRSKVTGELIIDGKKVPVKGEAYSDHQWGNIRLTETFSYWYWGRIFLPGLTIVFFDGEHKQQWGYQRFKHMPIIKGKKLIDYLHSDFYMEARDVVEDPLFRITYARTLVQTIDSPRVQGTITHKMRHFLNPPRPSGLGVKNRPSNYSSWVCDCDAKLIVDGEKIQAKGVNTHERCSW